MEISQITGKSMIDKLMYDSGQKKFDFFSSGFESKLTEVESAEKTRLKYNKREEKVSEFERVVAEVDRLQLRMKEIMDEVCREDGIDFRDSFLLQIEMEKIASYIETASKLIEQAVNSLKSVLQQQL